MKLISLNEWCSLNENNPDEPSQEEIDNLLRLLDSNDEANVELGLVMAPGLLKDSLMGQKKLLDLVEKITATTGTLSLNIEEVDGIDTIILNCTGGVRLMKHFVNNGKLIFPFKEVGGYFNCQSIKLTSLEGCPEKVGGDFNCRFNKLTSLEGCPEKVGGDFYFGYNDTEFTEQKVRSLCDVKGSVKN